MFFRFAMSLCGILRGALVSYYTISVSYRVYRAFFSLVTRGPHLSTCPSGKMNERNKTRSWIGNVRDQQKREGAKWWANHALNKLYVLRLGSNFHLFPVLGDSHQPNSRVYIPTIRILYVGWPFPLKTRLLTRQHIWIPWVGCPHNVTVDFLVFRLNAFFGIDLWGKVKRRSLLNMDYFSTFTGVLAGKNGYPQNEQHLKA